MEANAQDYPFNKAREWFGDIIVFGGINDKDLVERLVKNLDSLTRDNFRELLQNSEAEVDIYRTSVDKIFYSRAGKYCVLALVLSGLALYFRQYIRKPQTPHTVSYVMYDFMHKFSIFTVAVSSFGIFVSLMGYYRLKF